MRFAWLVGAMLASGCDLVFVLEPPPADADGSSGACPGQDDRVDLNSNCTSDCLENLVTNGQFATDVSGWTKTSCS